MVWSQVCGPSCCSCVLGYCGVSVVPFCRLGLLRALPCRVLACGFLWFRGPCSWCFLGLFPLTSSCYGWLGVVLPALRAGSPTYGWRCVLRRELVLVAVPPPLRLVLRIRTGFLFNGPGVCVCGLQLFTSPMYTFGMWSPFGSMVSFCHLITNEGLHCWLFLVRYRHPYWGRVVVFIRPL